VCPAIEEPVFPEILEAVHGSVHGGASAACEDGNFRRLMAPMEQQQDPGAERLDPAAGLLEQPLHPSSLPSIDPKAYRHRGGSPGLECCLATSLVAQLVPPLDLSDPGSVQAI
jgi:hypothetical protein